MEKSMLTLQPNLRAPGAWIPVVATPIFRTIKLIRLSRDHKVKLQWGLKLLISVIDWKLNIKN